MKKIQILRTPRHSSLVPRHSSLAPLLALLLAAQAPGCIRQYDDFVGAQDVASDNRADDGNPGDAGGGDVALDSAHTDVAEPKDTVHTDTVHTDTVEVDVCVPDCDGKVCGDDGCGGSCGECTGCKSVCSGGQCEAQPQADSGCFDNDIYWKDSCGAWGEKATECGVAGCNPGSKVCADCEEICGAYECGMQGDCDCGTCPSGQSCQAGQCQVKCGDAQCGAGEDKCNCPQDCSGGCAGCCSGTTCNTGIADAQCGKNGGTCQNCTADEESCVNQECKCACGDGMCCDTETCCTCSSDCGSCCGNGQCDCGETYQTCPADCESPGQCNPSCDPALEECVAVTTGGWACTAKMVEVPAGNFWMGCNNCAGSTVNDTDCLDREHPYHEVYLDGYEMDRTEVTAGQYLACVTAGGCEAPAGTGSYATYQVSGKESRPINDVTWYQVESYCLWAGKELCTEAQWEKGARGGCEHNGGASNCKAESRKYPWGNAAPTCDLAVKFGCDGDTQPVCSLSPAGDSPYGLCDMSCNVWEWVADWYQKDFYCDGDGATGDESCAECGSWPDSPNAWNNPYCNIGGSDRVVRGGSFLSAGYADLHVSNRGDVVPSGSFGSLGGRCCRSE